jgi:hypothetical protein
MTQELTTVIVQRSLRGSSEGPDRALIILAEHLHDVQPN